MDSRIYVLMAMVFASVIVLNIWNYERRSQMTPRERQIEDDELHEPFV